MGCQSCQIPSSGPSLNEHPVQVDPNPEKSTKVADGIIMCYGRPENFSKIAAIPVSSTHYRVNVYTQDPASFAPVNRMCDSFFLVASEDGAIDRVIRHDHYDGTKKPSFTRF